jgi:hypothetical protein
MPTGADNSQQYSSNSADQVSLLAAMCAANLPAFIATGQATAMVPPCIQGKRGACYYVGT